MSEKINKWYLLLPLALILLSSCHKKNQQIDYNAGITASQQYTSARQMMDLLMNTYFKSITDSILLTDFSSHIDGAVVTYRETPEQTIIIEYPYWGESDGYGHNRAGKITAIAPNGFYDSLAVVNFVFEDFDYDKDSLIVSGMTLKNLGRTDELSQAYNIKAVSITRLYSDTTGFSFDMDEVFKWEKDPSSVFHTSGERFLIFGKMNGYLGENNYYHAKVDEGQDVTNEFSCPYAKSGPAVITFDKENYTANVYFSSVDSCEDVYHVEIDEYRYNLPFD